MTGSAQSGKMPSKVPDFARAASGLRLSQRHHQGRTRWHGSRARQRSWSAPARSGRAGAMARRPRRSSRVRARRWFASTATRLRRGKPAMNQMPRTTAGEYAPNNIRVNAVLPGLMKTPMVEHSAGLAASYAAGDVEAMWRARDAQVPMGHMGDAWDVANAALYLASDESRYVTGIELVVDGGITLKAG